MIGKFFVKSNGKAARLSAVAIATLFFVSVMLVAAPLRAGSYTWAVSSGNWSIATNWGGTVPTINDSGFVVNGGTATVTTLGIAYNSLDIDGGSTLQMLSGNMQAGTFVGNGGASTWAIPAPAISCSRAERCKSINTFPAACASPTRPVAWETTP